MCRMKGPGVSQAREPGKQNSFLQWPEPSGSGVGKYFMDRLLTQCRSFVGVNRSPSKTWPRWPPQVAQQSRERREALCRFVDDLMAGTSPERESKIWAELGEKFELEEPEHLPARFVGIKTEVLHAGNGMKIVKHDQSEYCQAILKDFFETEQVSETPLIVVVTV